MVAIGNFLFHYRNGLFPLVYALVFCSSPPLMADYRQAALLGFLVAASGQFLRAVTVGLEYIIRGGRNRQVYAEKLVQGGLFAHCRNPLYVGNYIIILGVGLASNSLLFLAIAVPFFTFAYWAIIAAEENYLRNKFGQEFDDYCARVNRVLPNLSGLGRTLAGMRFNWRRLITAEYGSAYLWLLAIPFVTLKNAWLGGQAQPGNPVVWIAAGLLVSATFAYALARFLKKSGYLKYPVAPIAPSA
jgi:protein-S-isoprenylcysteine O-methyltransferase Ste14